MKMKRNYGADLFRILCCIGVLDYHIVDDIIDIRGGISLLIYFAASFCVPGFFLLSGYLIAENRHFDLQYYEKKAISTMSKLFGWIIFWSICHFMMSSEVYDLWEQFFAGAYAGGILPVAWFLFVYVLFIGIFAYPFLLFLERHKWTFIILAFAWMLILAFGVGANIVNNRPQSLWLHLYLGYFMLGMGISAIKEMITKYIKGIIRIISWIFLFFCSSLIYFFSVNTAETYMPPHKYYGKWYYTIWLVSLFMLCLELKLCSDKIKTIISRISSNTVVVYLGHLPVLSYITGKSPISGLSEALLYIGLFFIGLELMAELFRRIPLLRKLV